MRGSLRTDKPGVVKPYSLSASIYQNLVACYSVSVGWPYTGVKKARPFLGRQGPFFDEDINFNVIFSSEF